MGELQDILPSAIVAAALPSLALALFFWKGDDAISPEFKEWLGQKLSGVKISGRRADIEHLGRVFDLVYGSRYFTLSSFLRVAIVSTIAAVIAFVVTAIQDHGTADIADWLRALFVNNDDLSFNPRKTGRLLVVREELGSD